MDHALADCTETGLVGQREQKKRTAPAQKSEFPAFSTGRRLLMIANENRENWKCELFQLSGFAQPSLVGEAHLLLVRACGDGKMHWKMDGDCHWGLSIAKGNFHP